jgi:hypothetical protein
MSKIEPLHSTEFGLAEHRYRRFSAVVPGRLDPKDLESSDLWVHVGPQIREGDEVRAFADDSSFVAYLICTFSSGSRVRMKTLAGYELEDVDHDALEAQKGEFYIKMRGMKKWCIMSRSTGDVIKEGLPTQSVAARELEDYQRALVS